jgi:hypothetical protein
VTITYTKLWTRSGGEEMKTISSLAPLLLLIFACRLCSLSGNTVVPSDLNPYKGAVQALLPKETSLGSIKFKLETSNNTDFQGATDAVKANYTMQAGSISVPAQLTVANFASSRNVEAAMQAFAKDHNLVLEPKIKNGTTVGKRLSYNGGKAIMWSNGSLQCLTFSDFPKTTSNLEEALAF